MVTGLEDGTDYYIRLSSRNNDNETGVVSQASTVLSFKTLFNKPEAPFARDATSIQNTSFVANWDAREGKEVSYLIRYSTDIDFDSTKTMTSQLIAGENLSFEVKGLQEGFSYWYKVFAVNPGGLSEASNTIFVQRPLILKNLKYDSLRSRNESSNDSVSFQILGGNNNYIVGISYRGILERDFTNLPLPSTSNIYKFRIRDAFLDEIGGEFEIYVNDRSDTISSKNHFIYWTDIESTLPNVDFKEKWQMFSIPYRFNDNLIETIFDEMGPYRYKKEWRLMHYNGERYVDNGGGINRIELGKGYWFYTLNEVSIQLDEGTVNTSEPTKISLRVGWNQIGNPYNIPISFNSVRNNNQKTAVVENAITFNAENQRFTSADIIAPFEGAFVWSDEATDLDVSLVDDKSFRIIENEIQSSNIDNDAWMTKIYLDQGPTMRELASVGMHPNADPLKDAFDKMALPRFIKYTELSTENELYFYPWFQSDIRPAAEAESWLFTYYSNELEGLYELKWQNEGFENSRKQLWLIDEENGKLINMNQQNAYMLHLSEGSKISIHLTNSIEDKPLPYLISVGDLYPNPTEDFIHLNFGLPRSSDPYTVTAELIDLQGKSYGFIYNESVEQGMHEFKANIENLVPKAGMHLLKVSISGSQTKSIIKKVLIK